MEIILELLFEFFGELILQVGVEALAEVGIHAWRNTDGQPKERSPFKLVIGYTVLGILAGACSLLVFSESFARTQTTRVASLFLVPFISGAAMMMMGYWRKRRGQVVIGLDRFLYGYFFAFSMASVRYVWAG